MNSSFHIIVFSIYLFWILISIIRQFLAFGRPLELVRALSFLIKISFMGFVLSEILFKYFIHLYLLVPFLSSVSMGLFASSILALSYLGMVDQPTQLQRKVLKRLPLLGLLIGYGMRHYTEYFLVFSVGVCLLLLIRDGRFKIQVQRLLMILILMILGQFFITLGYLNLFDLFIGLIFMIHLKYVNDFLVKNLIREKLSV